MVVVWLRASEAMLALNGMLFTVSQSLVSLRNRVVAFLPEDNMHNSRVLVLDVVVRLVWYDVIGCQVTSDLGFLLVFCARLQ
jgi:hypothetical protein